MAAQGDALMSVGSQACPPQAPTGNEPVGRAWPPAAVLARFLSAFFCCGRGRKRGSGSGQYEQRRANGVREAA
jgi:hypothetical protein